ncbi:MAG: hypothetical protein ACLP9L_15255 [Thermoguttaceae bacterium]
MEERSESPESTPPLRYKKPKILTVDLPISLAKRLRAAGYNVLPGTFGRPYKVKKGDGFVPVVVKASVPNYSEQEIVVIDLDPPDTAEAPEGEKVTSLGELDWFAKAGTGVIDPRPRVMAWLCDDSDRILKSGGAFVLFAAARLHQTIVFAAFQNGYFRDFQVRQEIEKDNWSILSVLSRSHLKVESEYGTEIKVTEGLGLFTSFLRRHLEGATFSATLHPLYPLTKNGNGPIFFPLATSKFGETVAGVLLPRKEGEGFVLVLPQLEDKEEVVLDLVQTVLPEILPRLFPDHEGGRWVHREEYEHPSILERKAAQLEVQRKANEEVARLDHEIEAERDRLGFLHGILTKSGKALMADVKCALEFIGFAQVVDVDEADDAGANKQEDMQVLDKSPSLLLEIKGLAGMPTEGDTLKVTKYVLRQIRQWGRTDVIGLSLVNHQRNLPALERNHANAFTEQQTQDARQNGTGLMTTWDLFRLIRGMVRWGWSAETVRDVLYGQGRLQQLPSHYTLVGTVAHYWTEKGVVSIDVSGEVLRIGDRVGYLFTDGFFEEEVTSLQVEKKAVREAHSPQRVGMKTTLMRGEVPVGTQVFRVAIRS